MHFRFAFELDWIFWKHPFMDKNINYAFWIPLFIFSDRWNAERETVPIPNGNLEINLSTLYIEKIATKITKDIQTPTKKICAITKK